MKTVNVSIDRDPFTLSGGVIFGDTSGDASIIGGVEWFPPYVNDLNASIGEVNVTDYIASKFHDEFCELLVEAARDA